MATRTETTRRVIQAHIGTSQEAAIASPADETLYCGTRGCGKTVAQLLHFRQFVGQGHGSRLVGLLLDLQFQPLSSIIAESERLFYGLGDGARFNRSSLCWIWTTGERLYFGHCEKPSQAHKWLGHNLAWIGFNELTKWPTPEVYNLICSSLRTSADFRTRVFSTTNSYGVGHVWVKKMFIDPARYGQLQEHKITVPYGNRDIEETITRVALIGRYHENPDFKTKDIAGLMLQVQHNPECADSWLRGSWALNIGAAFGTLWDSNVHVVNPFVITNKYRVDRAYDHGTSAPFAVGWFAEDIDTGDVIQISELYGSRGGNKGLGLSAKEIARKILEHERYMRDSELIASNVKIHPGPADNQIRGDIGEKTIEQSMHEAGVTWYMAYKGAGSCKQGRAAISQRLYNAKHKEGAGFYVFDTCKSTIDQIPYLQAGEGIRLEDIADNQEDHVYDMIRYRLLQQGARKPIKQFAY